MTFELRAVDGADVRAYIASQLMNGLALARGSVGAVASSPLFVLVPGGTSAERLSDPGRGGLGQSVFDDLHGLLLGRFPGKTLVLELPLWRRSDVGMDDTIDLAYCDDQVFAVAALDARSDGAERVLRAADPAFMYIGLILDIPTGRRTAGCPADWLIDPESNLLAVMVGAYDGEGFVIAIPGGEVARPS